MMKSLGLALSTALLASVAGCGEVEGDGGDTPDGGGADTTAPTIVSTSPEPGATGEPSYVNVSIEFSEPMDRESVEGTLDTEDLGEVTVSWNDGGNVVTITPDEPLPYASGVGDDPSAVDAPVYVVTLGNAALDLAGNPLGTGIAIDFTTLKSMATTVEVDDTLTRSLTPSEFVLDVDDDLVVGDTLDNLGLRSVVTFDLSTLPASATAVESAKLATRQLPGSGEGSPYDDLDDAMSLDHITFESLDDENAINKAFNASMVALATHDDFCSSDQVVIEYDVTGHVDDDVTARADRQDRSQFLLYFEKPSDVDDEVDTAVISRNLMELQVTYLAP